MNSSEEEQGIPYADRRRVVAPETPAVVADPVDADSRRATDFDHRIIDTVSIALKGMIGMEDDAARLRSVLTANDAEGRQKTLAEVAVAFIRWAQDLKADRDRLAGEVRTLRLAKDVADAAVMLNDSVIPGESTTGDELRAMAVASNRYREALAAYRAASAQEPAGDAAPAESDGGATAEGRAGR